MAQVVRPPPPDGFVRIRIVGLDKNRRDVYLKFNAEVSPRKRGRGSEEEDVRADLLPAAAVASVQPSDVQELGVYVPVTGRFREVTELTRISLFADRNVSRSYSEFARFVDAIAANNPQSIIPALPLVQTSAATEEDDDRLVKAAFQRWVARITTDPSIARDDELRSFIESEFGVRARGSVGSVTRLEGKLIRTRYSNFTVHPVDSRPAKDARDIPLPTGPPTPRRAGRRAHPRQGRHEQARAQLYRDGSRSREGRQGPSERCHRGRRRRRPPQHFCHDGDVPSARSGDQEARQDDQGFGGFGGQPGARGERLGRGGGEGRALTQVLAGDRRAGYVG